MELVEIEKKARYITNSKGKPLEVILPMEIYNYLIELQKIVEIYQQNDTQKSIKKAKSDLKEGKYTTFKSIDEALEWLER